MVIKPIGLGEIHFEELLEEILTEYLEEFKSSVVRFCGFLPDTGCKWNVHETFRRRPGRFQDILSMFNIHPVPGGGGCDEIRINLFLAFSERAESTGATGDRLKEGAAINQSLSSLGNVIAGKSANFYRCSAEYLFLKDTENICNGVLV